MRLKHQDASQPAHPINVGDPLFRCFGRHFLFLKNKSAEKRQQNLCVPEKAALDYRAMAANRKLNFTGVVPIWAALLLVGAFLGTWRGYGGRHFAFALLAIAILLAGMLFPAAGNFGQAIMNWLNRRGVWIAVLVPLSAFALYELLAIGVDWKSILFGAAYFMIPLVLIASAGSSAPGSWQDYFAILAIWIPVELHRLNRLFPYPAELTHTLTILFALNLALAGFFFLRRLDGIGYSIEWGRGFGFEVGFNFGIFALIAIPLGEAIGFIHFDPSVARLRSLPLFGLGILFFTAWPEEFLFRGLIQNLLAKSLRSPYTALFVAAVIFGLSHINNGTFPNWRYVILATIAGIFYGRAWLKTGSIFASCLVHAAVDILWHTLFR